MPTLQWWTRDDDVKAADAVPYRLLEEVPELGAGAPDTGNMLIQGDNLEALKALLPFYAGQVKCISIDPPYNTRSAFEHYDDNLEHSEWLAMIYPRLVMLRELLTEDGSIWVTIDDNEGHYLKVVMDEVFGRRNFVANVIWEKADSPRMDARYFSSRHDHLLVYAKNLEQLVVKKVLHSTEPPQHYNKRDEKGRAYYLKPLRAMGAEGTREARPSMYFPLTAPDGTEVYPKNRNGSDGRWRWGKERFLQEASRVDWVRGRAGWEAYYRVMADENDSRPPETIWSFSDAGSNRTSKAEINALNLETTAFTTPKPEKLIAKLLAISTEPGDLVLDSFLGSGTTAAVAHKMGRRYIGIEMGEHAVTHCQPRLRKVINGEQGGISETVGWTGGGGFRFYRLGPAAFDENGQVRTDIDFPTLAAHIWFSEARTPLDRQSINGTVMGIKDERAIALLYNGVLRDRSVNGGNVLTRATLAIIRQDLPEGFTGELLVYGERCILSAATLERENIIFRQTPYDVKARA